MVDAGRAHVMPAANSQPPLIAVKPTDVSGTETPDVSKNDALLTEARKMVGILLDAIDKDKTVVPHDPNLVFSRNALKAFSSSESVSVDKFRNSGGLRSIVVAIRKHCTSSKVVESGCGALSALTLLDNSTLKEIVKTGAIDSMVRVLSEQAADGTEDACVAALKTLRNLTQSEENRNSIFDVGGMEAIILAMTSKPDGPRALSHAALVLSNLAFGNMKIKEAVGELGGLHPIARAMGDHKDYQPMQARGSLAFRNLCYNSDSNQRIAGEAGATEALVGALRGYFADREVVHQSCVALTNLSNTNEANRVRIVQAGGHKVLIELMKSYKDSATVNDDCISVIRNVAVGSQDAQTDIGTLGGVACVCEAMQRFSKDTKMVSKGCTALRYLCFLPENRDRVRQSKGIEAMIDAVVANVTSSEVIENALLAIGNTTFESMDNKAIVGRCGGIAAVISAIEAHRHSPEIQEHGCRVLRNLADGFEFNQRLEAENGAINTGVFAMMGYPDNASVQEQACAMLLNIALSKANLEKLRDADVERLAEKALNKHGKHRGVQLQGGSLLDRLNGYDVEGADGDGNHERPEGPAAATVMTEATSGRGFFKKFGSRRG